MIPLWMMYMRTHSHNNAKQHNSLTHPAVFHASLSRSLMGGGALSQDRRQPITSSCPSIPPAMSLGSPTSAP